MKWTYRLRKERAREIARIITEFWEGKQRIGEDGGAFLERLARQYGLIQEFSEKGILRRARKKPGRKPLK